MTYNLERRQSPRKRFEHLLYVELEPANGGMVLNFSEHGFGFRAAKRVRPKEEVKFAFNLDDKRRLEGRGRLEWTDKEGHVAGLQFTDVSEEFRMEMRAWLSNASKPTGKFTKKTAAAPAPVPSVVRPAIAELSASELPDNGLSSRLLEARAKFGSTESIRSLSSSPSNSSFPPVSDLSAGTFLRESTHIEDPVNLPWAAVLPPAIGFERKPTVTMPETTVQPAEISDAAACRSTPLDPEPAEELEEEVSSLPSFLPENAVADMEGRTSEVLDEHVQSLLQRLQREEERLVAAFRESAARVLRDSERQLFPIREAVQAQMKSLESSVSAATASTKVLDRYPSLLEKAQQQAFDRFQSQIQEALRMHVMELRRRSETTLEEFNAQARIAALAPRRIRTSSGIVITGIIVMLLALLFSLRREAAGAFIWLGQQMIAPATTSETTAVNIPDPQPKVAPVPTPAEALATPKENPPAPITLKDVHSLWNDVAKGDVSAELTLGTMYLTGHGVTKNCYQARRLLSAAARKGNEEAKQKLAQLDNGSCS